MKWNTSKLKQKNWKNSWIFHRWQDENLPQIRILPRTAYIHRSTDDDGAHSALPPLFPPSALSPSTHVRAEATTHARSTQMPPVIFTILLMKL